MYKNKIIKSLEHMAEDLEDVSLATADFLGPLLFTGTKGYATFRALISDIPTEAKLAIGGYGGLSALLELIRCIRGPNLETLHPYRRYQHRGGFLPIELLALRNYLVMRRKNEE